MQVRLYLLEGLQLVPSSEDTDVANPYIVLSINGKVKINDKDNKKEKTCNPGFYKCYQFETQFPSKYDNNDDDDDRRRRQSERELFDILYNTSNEQI